MCIRDSFTIPSYVIYFEATTIHMNGKIFIFFNLVKGKYEVKFGISRKVDI